MSRLSFLSNITESGNIRFNYTEFGTIIKGSELTPFCISTKEKNNTPIAFIKILMYIIGVVKL